MPISRPIAPNEVVADDGQQRARFGARVYFHDDGVILIKQTVLRDGQYRIDTDDRGNHKEDYAGAGDGQAERVLQILAAARRGELRGRGTIATTGH